VRRATADSSCARWRNAESEVALRPRLAWRKEKAAKNARAKKPSMK
jgi:hypothetical protein